MSDIDWLKRELEKARAELEAEREKAHYANGVADLAMKHRDAAEAERDALRVELAAERERLEYAVEDNEGQRKTIKRAYDENDALCAELAAAHKSVKEVYVSDPERRPKIGETVVFRRVVYTITEMFDIDGHPTDDPYMAECLIARNEHGEGIPCDFSELEWVKKDG